MKKTNEELLEFFGLKVGDKIKVECFTNPFVIREENGIQFIFIKKSKRLFCSNRKT